MKQIISSERIPVKLWCSDIEEGALSQAKNLANLPFSRHHIAIMADAHFGYGMPIGGVLAAEETIIPNAVGVDIGCGVCAVRTSLAEIDRDTLNIILGSIRSAVPTGFKHHKQKQKRDLMPARPADFDDFKVIPHQYDSALAQLGTLGGGNHFIEIQGGSDGRIWLMVHSGSRNLGYQVAGYYNKLAIRLNKQWKSTIDPKWQLAFLPLYSEEGSLYFEEMRYCVDFALGNRLAMMARIEDIVRNCCPEADFDDPINIAHNYAAVERHFGSDLVIHRKGATRAEEGETGIIPGSQGTPSYIVRGKGNRESFRSCSHGAGRVLGRKAAQKSLNLQQEIARLENLNILHSIRSKKDLDEAAGAYKDIEEVIADQEDLIDALVKLQPLAVIKG